VAVGVRERCERRDKRTQGAIEETTERAMPYMNQSCPCVTHGRIVGKS